MAPNPCRDYGLLWRALALSLLLHVVLLLQPGFETVAHPGAVSSLVALLRPVAANPTRQRAAPVPASPAAPRSAREASAVAPVPAGAPAPAAQVAAEITPVAAAGPNASGNETQDAPGMPNAASNVELDFAEARKSYLFAIAAEARRVKKYPPRAFAAGWTGTAEIRVVVAADGAAQAPRLHKSSGHADIDNAALSFVGIALRRTPLPEGLRGRGFDFVLPVSFTISSE